MWGRSSRLKANKYEGGSRVKATKGQGLWELEKQGPGNG